METRKKIFFVIQSIGIGFGIYTITGVLLASILVYILRSDHAHSMEEILYVFVPLIGAIAGILLGFVVSIMNINTYSVRRVTKQLLIAIPFCIVLFFWTQIL
ncbi:hypothetical protein [Aquimarina sp. I32.4]|uniref:hypothetical protein n=1 Tax=Aquimarina sp. I32.4 TaxID=2053903 RepID=UPI000CDF1DDB|nr:hypothetical protein [Aquimarina sp. I32.4]